MLGLFGRRSQSIGAVGGDSHRVHANVAGQEIFFESTDAPLALAPESFAGPLLLPAMKFRRQLTLHDPVDAQWLAGLTQLDAIYQRWWQYPSAMPIAATPVQDDAPPRPAMAACFTGGVDSFYSQLRGTHAAQMLLFVHGFDIAWKIAYVPMRSSPLFAASPPRSAKRRSSFAPICVSTRFSTASRGNARTARRSQRRDIYSATSSARC